MHHRSSVTSPWPLAVGALICIASVLASPGRASATPITINDFSGSETVITFDTPLTNTAGPVAYQGVTLTANSGMVGTATYGNMYNFPGASAGPALYDTVMQTDITISFPTPVNRVGLLLAGGNTATSWTVTIYDVSGVFIESTTASFTTPLGFPDDPPTFVGLQSATGIGSMQIVEASANGQYTGFDDLRFEAVFDYDLLWNTTTLNVGDTNCPDGGVQLDGGLDNGDGGGTAGDGVLDAGEVDFSHYVCNGADGADGSSALFTTTILPTGHANCAAGGTRVDIGLDNGDGGGTADDGVLDAGEIDDTTFICNGENGSDGGDGADVLVDSTWLSAGDSNCPAGGTQLDFGTDDNGDGVLDPWEVDSSTYVCNGADGVDGADGADGSGGCSTASKGQSLAWLLLGLALLWLGRRRRRSLTRS